MVIMLPITIYQWYCCGFSCGYFGLSYGSDWYCCGFSCGYFGLSYGSDWYCCGFSCGYFGLSYGSDYLNTNLSIFLYSYCVILFFNNNIKLSAITKSNKPTNNMDTYHLVAHDCDILISAHTC